MFRAERAKRQAGRDLIQIAQHADEIAYRCRTLLGMVRECWTVLEPVNQFVLGRIIEAIAEHLEAVSRGEITRLLINVPPGMMKSLLVSVIWQAWEWGALNLPGLRYTSTSYEDNLAKRDTRRTRTLVTSEWFKTVFRPNWLPLVRAAEDSFENKVGGWRQAHAFGSLTGKRGDRLLIDDPHSTKMAESDAERKNSERIFREDVPSRINDSMKSAIVIIMQRVHVNDIASLAKQFGYDTLILPMEFEEKTRCSTRIGFVDWRAQEGDLLFPERFPREAVERDKEIMLEYAVAAQYQQRPVPRDGGLFKRSWFENRLIEEREVPDDCTWWRHWDLAASLKKQGQSNQAWTAGVLMGRSASTGRFYVKNCLRVQQEGGDVRTTIKAQASIDGVGVKISLPQDPGQSGKVQGQDLVLFLAGYFVVAIPESGDKFQRAEPFAAQVKAGNVSFVRGHWLTAYIDELCVFPSSAAKDQVDASSGAFARFLSSPLMTFAIPFVHSTPRPDLHANVG